MILDAYRLRLWLQKENLPQDLRDTIEWFIDQEEEYRTEWDRWVKDQEGFETKIKELESKMSETKPEAPKQPGRYVGQGNTYPVKDLFKRFGFRWDSNEKTWYLVDKGQETEIVIKNLRAILKDQGFLDVDVLFVAGK